MDKTALLDATQQLIAERGLDGWSLDDVGRVIDRSRGFARVHYGSKGQLINAAVSRVLPIDTELKPTLKLDTLLAALRGSLLSPLRDPIRSRMVHVVLGDRRGNSVLARHRSDYQQQRVRWIAASLEIAQREGEIDPGVDVRSAAARMFAQICGTVCLALDGAIEDLEAETEKIVQTWREQFRPT